MKMALTDPISRVTRTKAQAKTSYDRLSSFYDYLSGSHEQKYCNKVFQQLKIIEGETVLEIGFGTGRNLVQMAQSVGEEGKVCGIDISSGMLQVSLSKLEKARLSQRAELTCDDATNLPYKDNTFDVVFMSFVLELFDTLEIPLVLAEVMRVMKQNGRVGLVSLAKDRKSLPLLKFYEWLHTKLPNIVDCRPIYLVESIVQAGFTPQHVEHGNLFGLPVDIVIASKPLSSLSD
jgi:ubiquinone/menaquinone biosynthesis C-methylase UbiE